MDPYRRYGNQSCKDGIPSFALSPLLKREPGLSVDQADDGAITDESGLLFRIKGRIVTVRIEPPIVVRVLVVVACDLLLAGAIGVGWQIQVRKGQASRKTEEYVLWT